MIRSQMTLDPWMIALFPWIVCILFYALGLVCAYNLYLVWYNWRLDVHEDWVPIRHAEPTAAKHRAHWHGYDIVRRQNRKHVRSCRYVIQTCDTRHFVRHAYSLDYGTQRGTERPYIISSNVTAHSRE